MRFMRKLLLFLITCALLAQNTLTATITVTASTGSTKFVTASTSGRGTRIYHLSAAWNTPADVYLLYGTGTNCGTSSTAITGVYKSLTSLALDFDAHPPRVPPGQDVCINFSTTVTAGGMATYDQQQ